MLIKNKSFNEKENWIILCCFLVFLPCGSDNPNHTAAVIAAVVLLILLTVAAVVYSQCHLNIKLWYRNLYGDYELNGKDSVEVTCWSCFVLLSCINLCCVCNFTDGKLYDAYISYVNNDADRKFVNFILKPHLENQSGYKVQLCDNDILPGAGKTTKKVWVQNVLPLLQFFF